jgi:hypothetical protein
VTFQGNTRQSMDASPGFRNAPWTEISGSHVYVGAYDTICNTGVRTCVESSGLLSNCIATPGFWIISFKVWGNRYFAPGLEPTATSRDLDENCFQENILKDINQL